MTDYLNPDKLYPDDISRRIDTPPGFDSRRGDMSGPAIITQGMFTSRSDLWETPQWLFDQLDAVWGFSLDVCAVPENAKCKHFITPEMDALRGPDPDTGLVPCGCGEWIYTIEKGSCMDYHVTAKCSECGWDWFSKDGVGNFSAVFSAFITNGDSKRDEAERFLIENAKANNKLNYCPNCGAKMENKP